VERRRLILRTTVVVALLLAVAGIVLAVRGPSTRAPQAVRQRVDAEAPAGVRIRVEVLNATRVRGLARRATMHLRDRGFDVVNVGTSRESRDSTLVLDRSGHADWAALVARALGGARVEQAPDSSRYLDVTVLVGATWRPPAEPFYP
jgi:hypothetical protein